MQTVVSQLIDHLGLTAQLYEELLDTERVKQRAIAAAELDRLREVVAREEFLVARAAQLAEERLRLTRQIAAALPALGPLRRLRQLIDALEGPEHDILALKHEHLVGLANEIHEVSRANSHLLRSSLGHLGESLEGVFGGCDDSEPRATPGRAGPPHLDRLL